MKISVFGKQLIADIKNARLKAAILTKRLVADILVGQFLSFREFADSTGITDAVAKLFGLNKDDGVNSTDIAELDVTKNLDDSTYFVDIAVKSVGKTTNDGAATSDSIASFVGKNIQDSVTFADNISSGVGFGAGDTVYATDDVGAQATIDDDQYMLFGKNLIESPSAIDTVLLTATFERDFTESISVTDFVQKNREKLPGENLSMTEIIELLAGKGLSDTLSAIDSGSLISQDYVDNNHYFDADYVGQSRTF